MKFQHALAVRVIVALLAVVFLAPDFGFGGGYPSWQYDPNNFPEISRWAGCKAGVIIDWERSPVFSYYTREAKYIMIGGLDDGKMPYYAGLMIFLHEVGHCLQDQNGELITYPMNPKKYELDADRYSADLSCKLGLNGRSLLKELFDWAKEAFGYEGDPDHGTMAERIAQGLKATACDVAFPMPPHGNASQPQSP